MGDYLPNRDQELKVWAGNFSALITATPVAYGLVAADATALATLVGDFNTQLEAASEPATRTPVTVMEKNTARARLVADIRLLARRIQATTTVTAAQKIALGLNVPSHTPTPVPPPQTRPVLSLVDIAGNMHLIRIVDETTPTRRARPQETAGAEVFVYVGINPPADLGQWQYKGLATNVIHEIDYGADDAAKEATIVARWINRKGETGPMSEPITARVAGGVVARAA